MPPELDAIRQAVRARRDDLVALAQAMVRTPSLPGEEQAVQELVAGRLRTMGLEVSVLPVSLERLRGHPAFGDDGFSPEGRIDVIGRWRGAGTGRSLILNGHVDVVSPGDESRWTLSPWSGLVREGRLYGRGACDMKSGLAAGIMAVQVLMDLGWRPGADLTVESVVGEESGGAGTLAAIVAGIRADGAIILEPTGLDLCPVQSGALTFRLTVPGLAAHGALRQHGVSAIEKFALLLQALLQLEADRHARYRTEWYDEPNYVAPINVGTVAGGEWHSTVPEQVVAEGRLGVFPGETTAAARHELLEAIRVAAQADPWLKDHPPTVEWFEGQFESGQTAPDHPLVQTLSAAHARLLGEPSRVRGVPYGADLRLFTNHAGIPTVLYGPGDVSLAHGVDEHIVLDDVVAATRVVALMICM